jgi:hypothetical protein
LKRAHVDDVVEQLGALGMRRVADWLDAEKNSLYGPRMENWKPFMGQSVDSFLLEGAQDEIFYSETPLMDGLRDDFGNFYTLANAEIELFFIDVFALFSQWHKNLAIRLDLALAVPETKCCLVIPYGLSEVSPVLTQYGQVWASVRQGYLQGQFCPIALRSEDLTNIKKFLPRLTRLGARPNPEKGNEMDNRLGTGPKPGFY